MDGSFDFHSVSAPALVPHRLERARAGLSYLTRQYVGSGSFPSFISAHPDFKDGCLAPPETFSTAQVLICLAESDFKLSSQERLLDKLHASFAEGGFVHLFEDHSLLPADVDCSVVAIDALLKNGRSATPELHRVMDGIASNTDAKGVLRVYLEADPLRARRVDASVCVNALYTFACVGREDELSGSAAYVAQQLDAEHAEASARYYPSPDLFLYFVSRLVRDFDWAERRFGPRARERLLQRCGDVRSANVLELSTRACAASNLGLTAEDELCMLADAQQEDGSWRASPCLRFGRTQRYLGGECLTTALALRALMSDNLPAQLRQSRPRLEAVG